MCIKKIQRDPCTLHSDSLSGYILQKYDAIFQSPQFHLPSLVCEVCKVALSQSLRLQDTRIFQKHKTASYSCIYVFPAPLL